MKAEYADADRARPERRHRHVIRPPVGAHDRPVVAYPAAHVGRPHPAGAHVAKGHGLDRIVDASGGHAAIVRRAVAIGEADGREGRSAASGRRSRLSAGHFA
jgi:hypothetical protein